MEDKNTQTTENTGNQTGPIRDEQGRFIPGVSGNPDGRPPMTEEEKIVKKATKELVSEYKEKLAEALPLISPVLIAKAMEGDMQAIKEVNDRVMGKAKETMEMQGGLAINFASVFKKDE